jgi:hypothetical protein
MTQVSPNRWVQLDLAFTPPEMVLADVIDGGDGTRRVIPRSWEHLVPVTKDLSILLGLGGDTQTLRRLIRAGFVEGGRVAPRKYTVNIESYYAHLTRCGEEPDFWEDSKRLKAYREAMF